MKLLNQNGMMLNKTLDKQSAEDYLDKIIVGDCQNIIRNMPSDVIHLTCTSPPYYNAKDYSKWRSYEEYFDFLENVFSQIYRVTKSGRMCVVNVSPIIVPRKSRAHESKRLAIPFHFFSLMERIGWKYVDDIVWVKPEGSSLNRNGPFFQHRKPVAYKPNLVTETIFVFQKPADFLIDKIVRSYPEDIVRESLVNDTYERSNVWKFNPVTKSKHLAPYPEILSNNIIKYYSFVGDVVIDPFMGSGTTAVSCIKLKRRYVGVEIHQEYVDLANHTLSQTKVV